MDPNILSKSNHDDMILYNIEKFKNHPSIKRIKDVTNLDRPYITLNNMVNTINNLDLTKSNPLTSIPTKIVVGNSDILYQYYIIIPIILLPMVPSPRI